MIKPSRRWILPLTVTACLVMYSDRLDGAKFSYYRFPYQAKVIESTRTTFFMFARPRIGNICVMSLHVLHRRLRFAEGYFPGTPLEVKWFLSRFYPSD